LVRPKTKLDNNIVAAIFTANRLITDFIKCGFTLKARLLIGERPQQHPPIVAILVSHRAHKIIASSFPSPSPPSPPPPEEEDTTPKGAVLSANLLTN
jgi:hypothetical protein